MFIPARMRSGLSTTELGGAAGCAGGICTGVRGCQITYRDGACGWSTAPKAGRCTSSDGPGSAIKHVDPTQQRLRHPRLVVGTEVWLREHQERYAMTDRRQSEAQRP
jgi:hypothetical protein